MRDLDQRIRDRLDATDWRDTVNALRAVLDELAKVDGVPVWEVTRGDHVKDTRRAIARALGITEEDHR